MKVYTFSSSSHLTLLNTFKESFERTNPNLSIHVDIFEQTGSGKYMEQGWGNMMSNKIQQIIKSCEVGEIFVHSDCDVYFFKEIKDTLLEELGDFDIAFQDDGPAQLCMGFFVCRPSERMINFFKRVLTELNNFHGNDQQAVNELIKESDISFKKLSNKFFGYGQLDRGRWNGEDFSVDPSIILIHANWTVGVENKLSLIKQVSRKV